MNDPSLAETTPVDPTVDIASVSPASSNSSPVNAESAHEIERVVLHRLQNYPGLKFTRLDVHRCNKDAICLEGFLESNSEQIDLCDVVRGIHGITNIVNRVVMANSTHNAPKKG